MKKYISIAVIAVITLLVVSSCEEELAQPELDLSTEGVVSSDLTNNAEGAAELLIEDAAETLETFEWNATEVDQAIVVMYTLQVDTTSAFATSVDLGSTEELSLAVTVGQINDVALTFELAPLEESGLHFRVISTIVGVGDAISISSAVVRMVTPYENLIDYPVVYLPGGYQGWAPDGDDALKLYSYEFDQAYSSIVYFSEATEFKITVDQSWDENYGGVDGTLARDGSNLSVAGAGAYELSIDLGALTYEISAVDHWGIIGDATPGGWDADTDMTYNGQRQMWEITTDLTVGEMKFRANDTWDVNLGDNDADGSLEAGGANIAIASAGNYTIRLDVVNSTYDIIANE